MFSYITATIFIFLITKERLNAKIFSFSDYDDSLDIDVLENLTKRLEIVQNKFNKTNRNKNLENNQIEDDFGEADDKILENNEVEDDFGEADNKILENNEIENDLGEADNKILENNEIEDDFGEADNKILENNEIDDDFGEADNKILENNEIDDDFGEAENDTEVYDDGRRDHKEYLSNVLRDDKKISKPPFSTVSDVKKVLAESDFGPLHTLMSQDPKPKRVGVGHDEFDFIGRLVPAKFETMPTLCTVVNIRKRIYITSARCVFGLTAQMVHVDYVSTYVKTMAFIFSEHPTVRMYDEIGVVVTEESQIEPAEWHPIPFFDADRTDDQYKWFDDLNYEFSDKHTHYIIGYYENFSDPTLSFELRQADVYVGLRFCHELYDKRLMQVPCFSPCKSSNPEDYLKPDPKCRPYLAGNGFAIVDKTKKLLLGIATWGIGAEDNQMLPGGFAIPNSKSFLRNVKCAEKIIEITDKMFEESPDLSNCAEGLKKYTVNGDGDYDDFERKATNGSKKN